MTSETIILSSSLIPTELMRPHLLKHTIQNAIVGMEGGHLRKGLRCFSHGLSKRRDIFLTFFVFWIDHLDLGPRAPRRNRGVSIPSFSPPHTHLPAFVASWHWPQLQRLPLGPFNGLCKQAGWLLGQIVYFVYSGTIPSRHV